MQRLQPPPAEAAAAESWPEACGKATGGQAGCKTFAWAGARALFPEVQLQDTSPARKPALNSSCKRREQAVLQLVTLRRSGSIWPESSASMAASGGRTAPTDLPLELWTAILRQLATSAPCSDTGVPLHHCKRPGSQPRPHHDLIPDRTRLAPQPALDPTHGNSMRSSGQLPAADASDDLCYSPSYTWACAPTPPCASAGCSGKPQQLQPRLSSTTCSS